MTAKVHAADSLGQKLFIASGLIALIYVILRFSPVPRKIYESCDRPCEDLQYPMICRVSFTIRNNSCPTAENGEENAAKHLKAGPTIFVCQNDVVFVNVNNMSEDSFEFHWQDQQQHSDNSEGVIISHNNRTNVQYKFRAIFPGTHIWHAHSAISRRKLAGVIVVRKLPKKNSSEEVKQYHDYDDDDRNQTIFISDCTLQSTTLLINGKSDYGPGTKYLVSPNRNNRFRTGYSGDRNCLVRLKVEKHAIKVLEENGRFVETPKQYKHLAMANNDRFGFIIATNQIPKEYYISIDYICNNNNNNSRTLSSLVVGNLQYENVTASCQNSIQFAFSTSKCEKGLLNS